MTILLSEFISTTRTVDAPVVVSQTLDFPTVGEVATLVVPALRAGYATPTPVGSVAINALDLPTSIEFPRIIFQ